MAATHPLPPTKHSDPPQEAQERATSDSSVGNEASEEPESARRKSATLESSGDVARASLDGFVAAIEATERERPGKGALALVSLVVAALVAVLLALAVVAYLKQADTADNPTPTTQPEHP